MWLQLCSSDCCRWKTNAEGIMVPFILAFSAQWGWAVLIMAEWPLHMHYYIPALHLIKLANHEWQASASGLPENVIIQAEQLPSHVPLQNKTTPTVVCIQSETCTQDLERSDDLYTQGLNYYCNCTIQRPTEKASSNYLDILKKSNVLHLKEFAKLNVANSNYGAKLLIHKIKKLRIEIIARLVKWITEMLGKLNSLWTNTIMKKWLLTNIRWEYPTCY